MFTTDQNLKTLEKKIRQATDLIGELRKEKSRRIEDQPEPPAPADDLPLWRESSDQEMDGDVKKLLEERVQIRKRVRKILVEIEKFIH